MNRREVRLSVENIKTLLKMGYIRDTGRILLVEGFYVLMEAGLSLKNVNEGETTLRVMKEFWEALIL